MIENSVIHACCLDGQGGCSDIDSAAPQSAGGAIEWWHIEYGQAEARSQLQRIGLPAAVVEVMTQHESRPRVLGFDRGLLILLRAVNLNPGSTPDDMVSLRIWIEPGRIVTARQRRLNSVQDLKAALDAGSGPKNEGAFLVALIERIATRIGEVVDHIEERVEQLEDDRATDSELRTEISSLRRQTAALRRFLAPQRDALSAVNRTLGEGIIELDSYEVREQADRITRYVEDLDLVRERTLVLQEELRNRIAQEQNARTYLLTIVAAIFLPLGFLTGVFGMNVAGMPGLESPNGFLYVVGTMLVLGLVLLMLMRWKRWL